MTWDSAWPAHPHSREEKVSHHYRHLTPRSGAFPNIDGVNVFKWRNDFDYSRWQEAATLTLCNVPFPADFSEIIDWQTAEARDAELAKLEHYTSQPMETHYRLDKNATVKVPIPFDIADGANYLIVRNGQAATRGAVDYEREGGIRDLFYFILDCEQLAPNTTRLTLKCDIWTTYFDLLEIEGGYVERGHAPMWHAAQVDEYLESPLDHTDHLTAADIEVSSSGEIVSYQRPTLLDDSKHMICFESQYDVRAMRDITAASPVNHEITALSYSGSWAENVNGWEWNLGADSLYQPVGRRTVRDAANRPPQPLGRNSPNQPGGFVYGVPAQDAQEFFERLFSLYPHFAQNINAVYLVPTKMLTEVLEYVIPQVGLIVLVQPRKIVVDIDLTRDKFAYPERYENLTKLYTSPYSTLVLSDALGNETEVRVQDTTSALAVNLYATLISGCSLRAEFDGVGGASGAYRWWVIESATEETERLTGHAGRFFQEKQLPVYRLAIDAQTRHDLANAKKLPVDRKSAIVQYGNGQRTAGTGYANALRSNATARANAGRSASTALANGEAANDTSLTNARASADVAYESALNSANFQRGAELRGIAASRAHRDLATNTQLQSNDIDMDFLDANNDQQNKKVTFQFNVNRQNRAANLAVSVDYQAQSLQNQVGAQSAQAGREIMYEGVSSVINTVSTTANAFTSAAAGIVSGDVGGAITGAVGGIINMTASGAHSIASMYNTQAATRIANNLATAETTLSIFKDTELADIETETDRAKINNTLGPHGIGGLATDYSFDRQIVEQRQITYDNLVRRTNLDISARNRQVEIDTTLTDQNSTAAYTLNTTNAALARDNAKANALRGWQTADANLDRSYRTSIDNADASRATGDTNAQDTYNIGTFNAQNALPIQAERAKAGYDAAAMQADSSVTAVGGNGFIFETRRDGFTVQVRTPNRDSVAQLGDFFLRWGYAANRVYDMSRLSLFSKFTYWQASDVYIRPTANAHILGKVKDIFRAGVTVWRRMEDVGTMCIYDNERTD